MAAQKVNPQGKVVFATYLAVGGCWALAYFLVWKNVTGVQIDKVEGIGIFAVFYVMAQAIERLIEPVVSAPSLSTTKPETGTPTARFLLTVSATKDKKNPDLAQRAANRPIWIWGVATMAALLAAAALRLDFLAAVGVRQTPQWAALLVTGLVIGAGTKPLHDLIKRIEAAKTNAQNPATPPAQVLDVAAAESQAQELNATP